MIESLISIPKIYLLILLAVFILVIGCASIIKISGNYYEISDVMGPTVMEQARILTKNASNFIRITSERTLQITSRLGISSFSSISSIVKATDSKFSSRFYFVVSAFSNNLPQPPFGLDYVFITFEKMMGIVPGYSQQKALIGVTGLQQVLTYGNKAELSRWVSHKIKNMGTQHLFVISGFHVGLVVAGLKKMLQSSSISRTLRTSILLIGIWSFVVAVRESDSLLRAGIMTSMWLLAASFLRQSLSWHRLMISIAILISLYWTKRSSSSLQLSTTATAAIIFVYPRMHQLWGRVKRAVTAVTMTASPVRKSKTRLWLIEELYLISFSVQVWLAPLLIWHFGELDVAAIFLGPLLTPFVLLGIFLGQIDLVAGSFCYQFGVCHHVFESFWLAYEIAFLRLAAMPLLGAGGLSFPVQSLAAVLCVSVCTTLLLWRYSR